MDTTFLSNPPDWLAPLCLGLAFLCIIIYFPLIIRIKTEKCKSCGNINPLEAPTCENCGESTTGLRSVPMLGIILLGLLFSIAATTFGLISALPYPNPPWDKLAISLGGLITLFILAISSRWWMTRRLRLKRLSILHRKDFFGGFCGNCGSEILGGMTACPNCNQTVTIDPPNWTSNPAAGEVRTADPHIICYKCKSENPSASIHCQKCRMDLLTFKPVWLRVLYFVISVLFSMGTGWLTFRLIQDPMLMVQVSEVLGISIISLALVTIGLPFYGLYLAFGKGAYDELLKERGDRHIKDQPWQALSDYSHALQLAPAKKHIGLLKNRMAVYDSLGLTENQTRDELANTYAREKNPQGGVGLFLGEKIFGSSDPGGGFATGYLSGVSKDARKAREKMFHEGRVIALAWCPACNCIMELDDSLRCPNPDNMKRHPGKPKYIQYVVPTDIQAGKDAIPKLMEAGKKKANQRAVTIVLTIIILSAGCWLLVQWAES